MCSLKLNISILINVSIHVFNIVLIVYMVYVCVVDLFLIVERYRYLYRITRLNFFSIYQEFDIVRIKLFNGFLFFDGFFCDLSFRFLCKFYRCYGKLCIIRKICRIRKCDFNIHFVTLVIVSGNLRLRFLFLNILRRLLLTVINHLRHVTSYVAFHIFIGNLVPGCSIFCGNRFQNGKSCSCRYGCCYICFCGWAYPKINIFSNHFHDHRLCCRFRCDRRICISVIRICKVICRCFCNSRLNRRCFRNSRICCRSLGRCYFRSRSTITICEISIRCRLLSLNGNLILSILHFRSIPHHCKNCCIGSLHLKSLKLFALIHIQNL